MMILRIAVLLLLLFAGLGQAAQLTLTGAGNGAGSGPQPTGKILLVDGASFILQTDGTSKICRAGGC